MQYLIQVVIYTGLLFTVYLLLLKDKPAHNISRAYLLGNMLLPLVLPFLTLPETLQRQMPTADILPVQLDEIAISAGNEGRSGFFQVLLYSYAAIAMLLITMQFINLYRINRIVKRASRLQTDDYTLLRHTGYGPGSWGHYIFLPDGNSDRDIIAHEAAHIQLKHTYDLLLLNIIQAICWPNVFLVLIRKELVLVHEFQADTKVDTDKEQYARLLVSSLFSPCTLPMTHSFIVHPIKRRIMMLYKKTNRSSIVKKSLLVAGITGLLTGTIVTLQSCERAATEQTVIEPTEDVKMPEFPGDIAAYLGKTLKYPKEAEEKKIEGRVIVRFAVDDQGNVKDPEILKSPDDILSEEALRVVKAMPKWIPGEKAGEKVCIAYTLPISFKLGNPAS